MTELKVKSEITGTVWKILVEPGAKVEEDDSIAILESMKMEIPISSPESGTVKEILLSEGDQVAEGQVILVLTV